MTKELRHIDWKMFEALCIDLSETIEMMNYKYEYIFGIPRGGLVPATMLSHLLEIPMITNLYDYKINDDTTILIVDDIVDSGSTMECYHRYDTAAVFWKNELSKGPQYCAEHAKTDEWIVFPWEQQTSDSISKVNLEEAHG